MNEILLHGGFTGNAFAALANCSIEPRMPVLTVELFLVEISEFHSLFQHTHGE